MARKKNEEIRLEIVEVTRKLDAYNKRGPLTYVPYQKALGLSQNHTSGLSTSIMCVWDVQFSSVSLDV